MVDNKAALAQVVAAQQPKYPEIMIRDDDILTNFATNALVEAIDQQLDRFYTEGPQEPTTMDKAKHEVLAYVRILIAGERT